MQEHRTASAPAVEQELARRLTEDAASRKNFLRMVGGVAGAGALAGFVAACGGEQTTPPPPTDTAVSTEEEPEPEEISKGDIEILNYALTLEFLEAKFYADVIESGEITDKALAKTAKLFGDEEQEHVEVLIDTIESAGGKPAKDPKGNFEEVIAGGPEMILTAAAVVENLGAAAYLGQATRIKSPEVLAAALSIHSVEARHAAALNTAAGFGFANGEPLQGSIPDGPFAVGMDMAAVLEAVAPYLPKKS